MSEATAPVRIGFIGLGIMGQSMAGHLLAAGHPLRVYNRSADKARALVERGAVWCATPGEVAAGSDVVITMVGTPRDVEEVWLGADGVLPQARMLYSQLVEQGRGRDGTQALALLYGGAR